MAVETLTNDDLQTLVLPEGQLGYDRRANQLKIGDGSTAWPELRAVAGRFNTDFPLRDGATYAVRNGKWVPIQADVTYSAGIVPPAVEEVNKQGEMAVNFLLPYKFAMNATTSAIQDIARREFRFPFAEGRIKKISAKTRYGGFSFNLLVGGMAAMPEYKSVSTEWSYFDVNTLVKKNDLIELWIPYVNVNATDLQLELLIQVGNASYVFVGEADIEPNVYTLGSKSSTWAASGGVSPNGLFYKPYIPSVSKLRAVGNEGWAAQGADGTWHVCGDTFNLAVFNSSFSSAPATPTPMPIPDTYGTIKDLHCSATTYCGFIAGDDALDASVRGLYIHSYSTSSGWYPVDASRAVMINKLTSCTGGTAPRAVLLESGVIKHVNNPTGKTWVTISAMPAGKTVKEMVGGHVLMTDGTVYAIDGTNLNQRFTDTPCDGHVVHIYGPCSIDLSTSTQTNKIWMLTDDDALYACGNNTNNALGVLEGTSVPVKVSDNLVPKDVVYHQGIGFSLLLTQDGKLYATGQMSTFFGANFPYNNKTLPTFMPIFENYKFHHITVTNTDFVGIGEYLGEIQNGGE